MKRRLRGSIIVEPIVIVVSLIMIVLIVKEFQTSVNTMKFETSMYLGESMRDVMMEQSNTEQYFRCEDNFNGVLWSNEGSIVSMAWKQTSEYFKIYDFDMTNYTLIGFDNSTLMDWLVTSECMWVIHRRRY